ncbi:MAG: permease [Veillonellales bacterium]
MINFKIILLSIVIEALPFVLLSVIVSAILHNFVTEDMISRIMPKNKFLSIVPASLLGIVLPVCDCGMVPIVRRLVKKGVPLPTAISFMLGAPILNPLVAAATAFAFKTNTAMVLFRLGTAFLVACFAGWLTSLFFKGNELKPLTANHQHLCGCCGPHTDQYLIDELTFTGKLLRTIHDASNEFFEMGKYLLIGAILGTLAQIVLSREILLSIGQHPGFSVGVMMLFAFVISVCSAADAFIAASFYTSFSAGSLVAFMVFGPMLDLKNTLMLLHTFRFRFVVWLAFVAATLCAGAAYVINLL